MSHCEKGKPLEVAKELPQAVRVSSSNVYKIIKTIRLNKRMSGRELAALIGVSEACVNGWENKRALPKVVDFLDMLDFLGYDVVIRRREK